VAQQLADNVSRHINNEGMYG